MVKFYESSFSYDYPLPAVSLAYFLRYPNPYATHVLSTDVIDRHFDPSTQRLSTTRLHLKKSKIPPALLRLLPKGIVGSSADAGQSYILEKSVIDIKEGWMKTESRNLEWTGILSVAEKQLYRRPSLESASPQSSTQDLVESTKGEGTNVTTTVTLLSRFGQAKISRKKEGVGATDSLSGSNTDEEISPRKGLFSSWSTSSLQRSIEIVGLRRTREATGKSTEGMKVVLERLRRGGLVRVLEGMQEDRQRAFGDDPRSRFTRAWRQEQDSSGES